MSPDEPRPQTPDAVLTTLRFIVVAMTVGLLSFAAITFATRRGAAPGRSAIPDVVVLLLVVPWVAAASILPDAIGRKQAREATRDWPATGEPSPDRLEEYRGRLAAVYQVRTIIRSALFEGSGFFALVAHMTGGPDWQFFLALGLAAAIATGFPSRDRLEGWIEARLDEARLRRVVA